ncbi:ahpC/TSA family protein [Anaplasma phagocytophilum]|uniref:AhpC/TSA family protein n=2 Tax=Anaplasma phagocytophilum TaxID=948 RepID=A0A0F3NAY0_ANAPH|nr:putative thiol-disulfide oxidoreductase [Anaplasma phagocytophilum str. HZ]KJV60234.1 ahpC/TSA family protein [Anaplasma phagocytophilum str. Webster]KJV65200.1 ahpC/TSA family protein [Anaplasma phagocytophilum str. NCH-1]KJV87647.1 ahpC/TSA family protein [Anaplasma phagocytophilum str. ApNYW]KJV98909.1 ahpC/TSA family protein [Anaplasma phagocytophilum str. Annie]KJZ98151.1 ahpC/TSA family protein [Anaplasma phagocytophilum]
MLELQRREPGRKRLRISKWLTCAVAALLVLSCYAHAAEQVLQHRRVQEILPRVFVEGKVSRGFKVSNKFLADLDGTELTLRDIAQDRVCVIVFWAPWNLDSVMLLQGIQRVSENLAAKDLGDTVVFLPISDVGIDDVPKVLRARDSYGLTLPMYIDVKHELFDYFDVTAIPLTLIVNRKGEVIYRIVGYMQWENTAVENELLSIVNQAQE